MVVQNLKVVQLVPELDEGGVEGETLDLAIYLAKNGHESIVISSGGRLVDNLEKAGCRHLCWPHIGEKSIRCLQYISKLRKFFKQEDVDIVHLRSRLPAWLGYLAWKTLDIDERPSLVTTFHGFYSVNAYSAIMTKGERVAAVSETIKQHITENYRIDDRKIQLIHGGFDTNEFSAANVDPQRVEILRKKWLSTTDKKTPIVILPGRLSHWKGQDVLIDAVATLPDIQFIALLIGDTEENPSYTRKLREKIKHLGLENKVLLVGHCSDMPAAILLADVVVSASSTQPEAFGKVAIEAMAMGKPIIATSHGGSLETVLPGETGWLVPPLNSDKMAAVIREALEDPSKAKRLGERGEQWAHEQFNATAMCEKTVDLYLELYTEKQQRQSGQKMTVMQLLPELNAGGVERGTLEMGRYLVQHGHRSFVVSGGGRLVSQLEEDGSTHITRKIGSKSPFALLQILPMRRLIRRNQVDVLHLRSRMPAWIGYIAWKTIPKQKRPLLITTFHGFYSVNSYSEIMSKGDGVIAVSESIRKHILEKYQRTKNVKLIFRGVDDEVFDPKNVSSERIEKLYETWGISRHPPVLMLPGRLTRLKGQELFLQSLLRVRATNYQAVLVGAIEDNPGYTAELQDFINKNKLSGRVRLVGYCNDMPAAFLIADIVLSASSLEPEAFGRTTVEAMAMGKPVIATAHGGSLETVADGETGWLIPPSDPLALAEAIDQALAMAQEDLKAMGNNGRQRVTQNFTALTMCKNTVSFYHDLLQEKRQKHERPL
jgi:glycosyltransferase involved in cell wall biosynthesis